MKIAAAAIRDGNTIYTGSTHFDAIKKILSLPNLSAEQKVSIQMNGEDGFITDTGQFVTREEAFVIATRAHQIVNHHNLADPEANKAFYGGSEPRLDSGIVESYAPMLL